MKAAAARGDDATATRGAATGPATMINHLRRELAEEGKVKPGLNIHGLRHSLGSEYDLGIERETRKGLMAHEGDAASFIYEQGGNRSRQADQATVPYRKHKVNLVGASQRSQARAAFRKPAITSSTHPRSRNRCAFSFSTSWETRGRIDPTTSIANAPCLKKYDQRIHRER